MNLIQINKMMLQKENSQKYKETLLPILLKLQNDHACEFHNIKMHIQVLHHHKTKD